MIQNKTLKEVILNVLELQQNALTYTEVYQNIIQNKWYNFGNAKTPKESVSAQLGSFIRNNDSRVKRIKKKKGFVYYLSKFESNLILELEEKKPIVDKKFYKERDLHQLLSSYLKNQETFVKTIFHEKSSNVKDHHQKWIHPDMVGVNFSNLKNKNAKALLKATNQADVYQIISYELKKEINNDYELKKCYFQAVSNSSWANYGFLVAFEISNGLLVEIERLNQSFGIGVIELSANPFESKILFPSKYKELDFKTIDKLCKINNDFNKFIKQIEKVLTAPESYMSAILMELEKDCDKFMIKESEIEEYCNRKNIPYHKRR